MDKNNELIHMYHEHVTKNTKARIDEAKAQLSKDTRAESREDHQRAESNPFIVGLMKGELPVDAYRDYLTQLAVVYESMEKWFPTDWPIFDLKLARLENILSDIEVLGGSTLVVKESTDYANYLSELIKNKNKLRLLAHHYARYLGDLSGGQAISKIISRTIGVPQAALTFYIFDHIPDVVKYKNGYRAAMDSLDLSEDDRATFMAEVKKAFEMNSNIFTALGRKWIKE